MNEEQKIAREFEDSKEMKNDPEKGQRDDQPWVDQAKREAVLLRYLNAICSYTFISLQNIIAHSKLKWYDMTMHDKMSLAFEGHDYVGGNPDSSLF